MVCSVIPMGESWTRVVEILKTLHVSDPLLHWHFRQSILANMRGNGEPILEDDFARLDMARAINEGPSDKERFEMELQSRLIGLE